MAAPLPSGSPRQGLPVWYGMGLGAWLRLLAQRPPMQVSQAGRIAGITGASLVNSMLHAVERTRYGRQIERVRLPESPLFILGHWRSGTTLLHNLLVRDPGFVAPTHFQVSFPGHFLVTEGWLSRLTAPFLPTRRPMDAMKLRWDLPGEGEIALLLTTLMSPYLRAAFPAGNDEIDRFDDLRRNLGPEELECWKRAFTHFLKKVTLKTPGTLLLKSPAHTGRIPLLLELFPKARFVYIVRNPYEVFASTRHLQRVLLETNRFMQVEPVDLDERVLAGYQQLYNAYHLHRALIPPARRYELRFEELVSDPLDTLEQLYTHLGYSDFAALRSHLESALEAHREHRQNVYQLDESTRQRVYERWRPAFNRYGYRP